MLVIPMKISTKRIVGDSTQSDLCISTSLEGPAFTLARYKVVRDIQRTSV